VVEKWAKNICFGNHDSFINIHCHSNYTVIEMPIKNEMVNGNNKTADVLVKQLAKKITKCNTIGDSERVFGKVDSGTLIEMRDSMEYVNKYFGMDMRNEFFLRQIKGIIDGRARGWYKEPAIESPKVAEVKM